MSSLIRDDYTFGGWYSNAAFTARVSSISNTQTGAVTLYADWLPITVINSSATFDLGNMALPSDLTSVSAGVSTKPSSADESQSVAALLKQNSTLGSLDNLVLHNLKLLNQNGSAITFTGSVTVRRPVPQGMTNPHVYWFDSTSLHDMNATVQDGFLVFTTTHFS